MCILNKNITLTIKYIMSRQMPSRPAVHTDIRYPGASLAPGRGGDGAGITCRNFTAKSQKTQMIYPPRPKKKYRPASPIDKTMMIHIK